MTLSSPEPVTATSSSTTPAQSASSRRTVPRRVRITHRTIWRRPGRESACREGSFIDVGETEGVSRRKLERLLNLTMCLMSTRRFLTVEEIGRLVDGYDPDGTPEEQAAFRRMFERDKEDLRDLGV